MPAEAELTQNNSGASHAGDRVLTSGDVEFLYLELLGRSARTDESALQLAATDDWQVLLHAILTSDEFEAKSRKRSAPGGRHINFWIPETAAHALPSGTLSAGGDVLVGEKGWLFLVGGSNAVRDQYAAEARLDAETLEGWHKAVDWRTSWCHARGIDTASCIVPDKLSLLRAFLPPEHAELGDGLAKQLVDAIPGIVFPAAALSRPEHHLRTDTHLSLEGATQLANALLAKFGCAPVPVPESVEWLLPGDLGAYFDPAIVELARAADSLGAARVTRDNSQELAKAGRHVGTTTVLENDLAPHDRTVVVFGDSYARPVPGYQGLAWFAAQQFRTVHFVWEPFGFDPGYVEQVRADIVIFEMAERFVVRPPQAAATPKLTK